MLQKRFWMLFSLALAIVAAAIVGTYTSLQDSVAARPPESVCWNQEATPICYSQPVRLSNHKINALAVNPSGQTFVTASRDRIEVWDGQTGKRLRSLQGHKDWISALAISPNGTIIASASLDGTVKLWDLLGGKLLTTLDTDRVSTLAFSPDATTLAAGSRMLHWTDGRTSRGGIQLWDVATQQLRETLGSKAVNVIAFSPDGTLLAGGSTATQVWDLATQKPGKTLNSGDLTALRFTPDGQTLVTGSSRIKLWLPTGQLVRTLPSGTLSLAFAPDGQTFATAAGGTIYLWRSKTWQVFGSLRGSWYSGLLIGFAQEGQALVSGSSDGLRLWRSQEQSARSPGKLAERR